MKMNEMTSTSGIKPLPKFTGTRNIGRVLQCRLRYFIGILLIMWQANAVQCVHHIFALRRDFAVRGMFFLI